MLFRSMRMPKALAREGELPWNGMMCLPRVVDVADGQIYFRVHPEVDRYFGKEIPKERLRGDVPFRLRTSLKEGEGLDIGGYRLWVEDDSLNADRSKVFGSLSGYRLTGSTPKLGGRCELDIFVDGNLIEVFVNGGRYVLSHVVYGLGDKLEGPLEHVYVGG